MAKQKVALHPLSSATLQARVALFLPLLVPLFLTSCHRTTARDRARGELKRCIARLAELDANGPQDRALAIPAAEFFAACPLISGDSGDKELPRLARAVAPDVPSIERAQSLDETSFHCKAVDAEMAALTKKVTEIDARSAAMRALRAKRYGAECGVATYGLLDGSPTLLASEESYVAGRIALGLAERMGRAKSKELTYEMTQALKRLRLILPLPEPRAIEGFPVPPDLVAPSLPNENVRGGVVVVVGRAQVGLFSWPLLQWVEGGKFTATLGSRSYALRSIEQENQPMVMLSDERLVEIEREHQRVKEAIREEDPRHRTVSPPIVVVAAADAPMGRVARVLEAIAPGRGDSLVFWAERAGEPFPIAVRALPSDAQNSGGPTMVVGREAIELTEERSKVTLRRVAIAGEMPDVRSLTDELTVWRKVQDLPLRVRVRGDATYRTFVRAIAIAKTAWSSEIRYVGLAQGEGEPELKSAANGKVTITEHPSGATELEVRSLEEASSRLGGCIAEEQVRLRDKRAIEVGLRLVIRADGQVSDAGLAEDEAGGARAEFDACLGAALRVVRFPESSTERRVHVKIRGEAAAPENGEGAPDAGATR